MGELLGEIVIPAWNPVRDETHQPNVRYWPVAADRSCLVNVCFK